MIDLEAIGSGYGLIEGPRVDADGNLFFSDVVGGGVYRRSPDGDISTVVPKRRGVGGIALHADGGVVVSGRNVCHVKDGNTRVIFERDDVAGFNDLFTDAHGRVLVGSLLSDPFGRSEWVPGGLWRIDLDGTATMLYGDVGVSNGIAFSPDGRVLYHSDSAAQHVIAHDVVDDVSVANRRVFATDERGAPDGLAVDESGRVWVASYGGGCVLRFTPDGELDETIDVDAVSVTSLCFGGSDRRDLYVVTADNTREPERKGTIFRGRAEEPGLPVPLARI